MYRIIQLDFNLVNRILFIIFLAISLLCFYNLSKIFQVPIYKAKIIIKNMYEKKEV